MSRPRAFGPSPLADLHPVAALFEAYLRSIHLRPALADIPGAALAEAEDFLRGRPSQDRPIVIQHAVFIGPLVQIG